MGLLFRPAAANDRITLAFSVARAARNPALEELYFFGPHPGNFAFEIGNADLDSEKAIGFDASLRWRARRASRGDYAISGTASTTSSSGIRSARKSSRKIRAPGRGDVEFPFIQFMAADSLLQGIEAHSDIELGAGRRTRSRLDYVRGELRDSNQPLPRIPPLRFRGGLHYRRSGFQAGGEVTAVSKQDRVFGEETPTDGLTCSNCSVRTRSVPATSFIQSPARLENATDELYRNHLSLIKDFVPEMGRNFKLVYPCASERQSLDGHLLSVATDRR